jgi:hypothetical protein
MLHNRAVLTTLVFFRCRAAELRLDSLKLLEVCGGDGRLSAYLRAELNRLEDSTLPPKITVHCTDSGRNGLHVKSPFG